MNDTPLMKQYHDMKKQYSDMILFFRLGDFYEMFDEDAIEVSGILNLTLTHKGDNPMCGIPFHAAKNYIKRLLDAGKKIAVCEQLELSDSSKNLAKREVVRIITPATVVDQDFLNDFDTNYILSVFSNYCAYCDVSTGDFHFRILDKSNRIQNLRTVLSQLAPKEILVCEEEYFSDADLKCVIDNYPVMITKLAQWYFSYKNSYKVLCENAQVESLSAFGIPEQNKMVCPGGALLKYIIETSKSSVGYLTDYKVDSESDYLSMDESTRRNLELFNNLFDGSSKYSLCDTINRCKTASGTRLLKNWLSFPIMNIDKILFRQKWVSFFYENIQERERIRSLLSSSLDLNRLTTRVLLKRAVPHDLVAIKQSVGSFFNILSENDLYKEILNPNIDSKALENLVSLMTEIDSAISEDFLGQFNEGEVILSGYDEDLDSLRNTKNEADLILKKYLDEEKENTGITILKLGYNKIFGYYIEVPNGQVSKVPEYFIRKQTLVNGERFTTHKLFEYEQLIAEAGIKAEEREKAIYNNILSLVLQQIDVLNSVGVFLNHLDVFQSLATIAFESGYCKPLITLDEEIHIVEGRHPVVEKQLNPGAFVANDLNTDVKFSLVTGPNMAGKSTYLRQNALIILLAHIGSYVPAKEASIGVVDRIFCRVGASDNLARGESTFLIEMQETAFILRNCTSKSFVIVDEIGRGTSTQDGMSLAYAIMQDLIKRNVKTLFATHYHELTMINTDGIRLLTLDVYENKDTVRFLRKVREGVANSSYGIHVARMAGIPLSVISEAKKFQARHFEDYSFEQNSLFTEIDTEEPTEMPDMPIECEKIFEEIKQFDIDNCTPIGSMLTLSKIREEVIRYFDNK